MVPALVGVCVMGKCRMLVGVSPAVGLLLSVEPCGMAWSSLVPWLLNFSVMEQ